MVLLLLWGCKTDVEDAAGVTARGYAVDPRASLLDLVSTPYVACEGDDLLLPKLAASKSPSDTVKSYSPKSGQPGWQEQKRTQQS